MFLISEMQSSLAYLEYHELKNLLAGFARSPLGRDKALAMLPLESPDQIAEALGRTSEAVRYLETHDAISFSGVEDPRRILSRLRIVDAILEPSELLALGRLAEWGQRVRETLRPLQGKFPRLARLAASIPDFGDYLVELRARLLPTGEVRDDASAELSRIRAQLADTRRRIYRLLEGYISRPESGRALQDDFITQRNGRFVVPVKVEQKRALPGVVHGTSSSGATLFIEPFDCIELNNRSVDLQDREREEVARILAGLTRRLAARLHELELLAELAGEFDFIFARAAFSRRLRAVEPRINCQGKLRLVAARHPLLEEALRAQARQVVPISLELTPEQNVLVISGPNAGGKTVALKTAGLLTLMAHSGLHVPAEDCDVPLLRSLFADIGDRQSIAENLSTFSSHISNICEMIVGLRLPALVLLDEVGAGTDPDQGGALGIAIIDHFRRRGALVIATTHHNSIKAYAFVTPGVANAATEFDDELLVPTYRLIPGLVGASSGIEIARRLGLPEQITEHASRLLSARDLEAERYLAEIRRRLKELEKGLEALREKERQLEAERSKLEQLWREREAARAKQLAAQIERLRQLYRRETAALLEKIESGALKAKMQREAERARRHFERAVRSELSAPDGARSIAVPRAGDRAKIVSLGLTGVVAGLAGNWAEVEVNGKLLKVEIGDLEPFSEHQPAAERSGPSLPEGVVVELEEERAVERELNLIGCTVEEALARADKFLDRALLFNLERVRLIHGHGTGRLRKAITEYLRQHPLVANFYHPDQSEGGSGATVVELATR